jgi:hypothetical protein
MSIIIDTVDPSKFEDTVKAVVDEVKTGNITAEKILGADQETNKLLFQMANISLEQAMSMWASGVGKAGGLAVNKDVVMQGKDRATFEADYKYEREKMQTKYKQDVGDMLHGNRPTGTGLDKGLKNDALGAAGKQAQDAKLANSTSNKSTTINANIAKIDVNSNSTDPAESARQTGQYIAQEIYTMVNDSASPVIS